MFSQKNDFFSIIWITEFLYFRSCCFQRGLKASPEQRCTVRINIYTKNLTVIFDRYLIQESVNGSILKGNIEISLTTAGIISVAGKFGF